MSDFKRDENGKEMYLCGEGTWKYRSCTSCGEDGHIYSNCKEHPFWDSLLKELGKDPS